MNFYKPRIAPIFTNIMEITSTGANTLSVDARALSEGVYFCKVISSAQQYAPVKIVVTQ